MAKRSNKNNKSSQPQKRNVDEVAAANSNTEQTPTPQPQKRNVDEVAAAFGLPAVLPFEMLVEAMASMCDDIQEQYLVHKKEQGGKYDLQGSLKLQIVNSCKNMGALIKKMNAPRATFEAKPFKSLLNVDAKATIDEEEIDEEEDPFGELSDEIANNADSSEKE